ncbi:MAG: serine/threonine-protein kinase, partial [Gemmatimonadales bacterium]
MPLPPDILPDLRSQTGAFQRVLGRRYVLERTLGRGGMGIVFLAWEPALERPVALKLLPPERAVDPVARARFLREARTAARLSHPNIVPIFAVDEIGEYVFFSMPFIAGETLGDRVRFGSALEPREAARLLHEVAAALGYAHARGVVH